MSLSLLLHCIPSCPSICNDTVTPYVLCIRGKSRNSHNISNAIQEICIAPSTSRRHLCSFVHEGQGKKAIPALRVQFSLPRTLVSLFCEQRTKADPLEQEQSKHHLHFLHHHGPCVSAEYVAKPFRECRFGHPAICFSY